VLKKEGYSMRILVLCDDMWHPAEVIKKGLADWDEVYEFEYVCDAKDILTKEMLREYPVIMNCKSDCLICGNDAVWFEDGVTEAGVPELEEYVREGGTFLSVHAGNVSNQAYGEFVGNHFVKHPPRCEVTLKFEGRHELAEGMKDFTIRDEHYEIQVTAEDADIFLYSESESGGRQAAGYTRVLGKGKICVLTPGHILAVWKNENFRRLLERAVWWGIKGENQ